MMDADCVVVDIKCMCPDCSMEVPSAARGGQRKESKAPGSPACDKELDMNASLKLVKRHGKGEQTYLMANGKFVLGCSAKKSKKHWSLMQRVKLGIENGTIKAVAMAKRALED